MEEENENLKEEEEDNSQQSLEESNLMPTVQMLKIDKRPKQLGEEPEIRRHPRLDNYKTNYWKNQERKDNSGCGIGRQPIWLAVENARFSATEFSINSETAKECAKFCSNNTKINFIDENGRNKRCNAFSFNENEKKCEPAYSSIEFPSSLVQLSEADFTQRAFRRLCYSENFYPFTGCSDFIAFMDYRLSDIAISPKELYDGLPKNVQGLSACIELCVLANDFECLSGFFDALNGKCALYDVNSLSNPSSFCKHSGNGHQLYFEVS
ncbi:hypothetical protein Mgra_00001238 [Meloidogyne graminicola]|uniref:Apple domain-containing protein n=1 Tax=Meloidogyne graminicola TaxID=189291 RepID=A0A8T0A075_9BILA|nr:hypothetical protein Mgra_00001238 [Meloidogyne graminicola]